jgi:hypothetical protein
MSRYRIDRVNLRLHNQLLELFNQGYCDQDISRRIKLSILYVANWRRYHQLGDNRFNDNHRRRISVKTKETINREKLCPIQKYKLEQGLISLRLGYKKPLNVIERLVIDSINNQKLESYEIAIKINRSIDRTRKILRQLRRYRLIIRNGRKYMAKI